MTIVFIGVIVFLFLIGMPVAFALGIGSVFLFILQMGGNLNYGIVAQRMLYGVNNFVILAIPFFMLAGKLMNTGGMTTRIFSFATCLVGHFRGGLGHVNIVASLIFSGMTGAASSDAAGLGAVEIKAMRDAGYDEDFAVAITAASSTVGPIIPPSIPLVIYGLLATVSVGRLLIGGIIPGLLLAVALMVITIFYAHRKGYEKTKRASLRQLGSAFVEALPALVTPVIIVGGILFGIFTPTEAAAVAVLYALVIGLFIYRELKPHDVWIILKETMRDTAVICFIITTAMLYGLVLIRSRIPIILLQEMTSITTDPVLILLILNAFLFIVGCFMETAAALSILVPVLTPLLIKVGIDPLHFGLVMVLNLMIGLNTPPFGLVAFILSQVGGVPLDRVFRAVLPFLIPLVAVLLLITLVPSLVTFLPYKIMG